MSLTELVKTQAAEAARTEVFILLSRTSASLRICSPWGLYMVGACDIIKSKNESSYSQTVFMVPFVGIWDLQKFRYLIISLVQIVYMCADNP